MDIVTRAAVEADLKAVHAIYAQEVLHGTASFELDPPTPALINERWQVAKDARLPYLVAEVHGKVIGFA